MNLKHRFDHSHPARLCLMIVTAASFHASSAAGAESATFRLDGASGAPGEEVTIPFFVTGSAPLQGYSASIDFDETLVELLRVEHVWQRADGLPFFFDVSRWDSSDPTPGSTGITEGYVYSASVLAGRDDSVEPPIVVLDRDMLPPPGENEVLHYIFRIRDDAPLGETTEIRFVDGAPTPNNGPPVQNVAVLNVSSVTPRFELAPVRVPGVLKIARSGGPGPGPDLPRFLRGDANTDGQIDISDPIATLSFLFLGIGQLACEDAADTNDDGKLDLSDPVSNLTATFLGRFEIPPPSGVPGVDPTEDEIGCEEPAKID